LRHRECIAAFGICVAAALGGEAAGQSSPGLEYPPAVRGTAVDDYHGTLVPDPYRGLENLDSTATRAWVDAQAKLTERYLAALPGRDALRSRLARLYDYERFGVPFMAHGRVFYTHNSGLQNQSVLYVADSVGARPRVALDPNALSKDGRLAVVGYVASRRGQLLAYGVSVSGSDWTDWHLRDLSSGRDLPDVIRHTKYYAPVFSHDDRGLYYSAFPAPAAGAELSAADLGDAVFYHAIGTAAAADPKLIELAGHPAIDHPDHTAGHEHQVAGMRVGVVERVAENHLEVHVGTAAREFIEVGARGGERGRVGAQDAIQSFHGQDAARRELPISAGEMDGIVLGEVFRELFQIASFEGEIQLAQQCAAELPDDRSGLVRTNVRGVLFC
jgi:hypothetical protein